MRWCHSRLNIQFILSLTWLIVKIKMKFSTTLCILTFAIFGTALCMNCKKVCRKIYDPYCLTYEDGTKATFANNCVLDIEICLNGLNSKGEQLVATKGACDDEEEYSYFLDNISDDLDVTT